MPFRAGRGGLAVKDLQTISRRRHREYLVPRQNIGIQMFSLRDMQEAPLPGTLQMLADIGYAEVELFTLMDLSAADFRAALDAGAALDAVQIPAHVGIDRWHADNGSTRSSNEAETLGMHYVGLPGSSRPRRRRSRSTARSPAS